MKHNQQNFLFGLSQNNNRRQTFPSLLLFSSFVFFFFAFGASRLRFASPSRDYTLPSATMTPPGPVLTRTLTTRGWLRTPLGLQIPHWAAARRRGDDAGPRDRVDSAQTLGPSLLGRIASLSTGKNMSSVFKTTP